MVASERRGGRGARHTTMSSRLAPGSHAPMSCRLGPAAAALLVAAAALCCTSAQVIREPSLAEILSDPGADGYDRTFSRCEVEAEDFQATVTSTAYRVLKGVCNPADLEEHLSAMEQRINEKMDRTLATILQQLQQRHTWSAADAVRTEADNQRLRATADIPAAELEPSKQVPTSTRRHSEATSSPLQNDHSWNTDVPDTEKRKVAVQRLLPKPAPRSSLPYAGAEYKKQSVPERSNWPTIKYNRYNEEKRSLYNQQVEGVETRRTARRWDGGNRQNSFDTDGGDRVSGDFSLAQQRHSGDGRHVTDTISSIPDHQSAAQSRYPELAAYNDTVYHRNGRKMYSYYWNVQSMREKMFGWRQSQSLDSTRFYVFHGGYRMSMRMFPARDGSVLIRAGVVHGRHDSRLRWPFALPFRVTMLDHSRHPRDFQSRTWRPADEPCPPVTWQRPPARHRSRGAGHQERRQRRWYGRRRQKRSQASSTGWKIGERQCLGLSVPHRLITQTRVLFEDAMVVKLDVFLENQSRTIL